MNKQIEIIVLNDSVKNQLQIFDCNNKKITETYINNRYTFIGKISNIYKIRIISNTQVLNTCIYITKNNYPYIFDMRKNTLSRKIYIKLKDQNYDNLKIKKGEIKLWQKIIT